ncbi:MAG: hypothetical protein II817_00685 [Bacteroidales bacterium]|nr:hypothetical protein [Bacteroidales bacterium]
MKRYQINITLTNGDELDARVVGRNRSDALRRIEQTEAYINFVGNHDIKTIDIRPIPIEPIDNERFAVTTIDNKPGWYVVADLDNRIKIEFKKGRYNDTQRVLPIGEGKQLTALQQATALREIGEYLYKNFKEII